MVGRPNDLKGVLVNIKSSTDGMLDHVQNDARGKFAPSALTGVGDANVDDDGVIKDDEDVGIDTNEEEGDKDLTMR
jgi:hypothetical protein